MEAIKNNVEEQVLDEKTESLIAIGAATAANCIPCFEHLYEKAVTCGLTTAEIKRATDLAEKVKNGAHMFLTSSVNELIGNNNTGDSPCRPAPKQSCCC